MPNANAPLAAALDLLDGLHRVSAGRSLRVRKEERSPRAVAVTALSSSASAVLEEADGVAVGVLHGDDLPAAADVTDLPLHLPAGVQQNMATITDGRFIFAYACAGNSVIETWFDTTKPHWNISTGNALWAGGMVIDPGPDANYVGAAWQHGTRIVWWTTVGSGR